MVPYGSLLISALVAISALGALSCHIMTSSRLCFVGARQGHFPNALSLITMDSFTPKPALIFLVRKHFSTESLYDLCASCRASCRCSTWAWVTSTP